MKKILLFLATVLVAVSCNNDDLSGITTPNEDQATIDFSVTLAANSSADTRVSFADDNAGGYTVQWKSDDTLGAWVDGGTVYNNNSFSEFTIENFGADESTFTGSLTYGSYATEVRFIHPYTTASIYAKDNERGDASNYCNAFDISLAAQEATSDLSHLNANTYMMSDVIETGKVTTTTKTPSMKHLGAVIDLNIKCEEAKDYSLVSVEVSSANMPSAVTVNMQKEIDDEYFEATAYEPIAITVPSFTADSSTSIFSTVPFNIFPFELAAEGTITVKATFVDADGNYYVGTRTITNGSEAKLFERATRNTLNATITDALVGVDGQLVITPDALGMSEDGDVFASADALLGSPIDVIIVHGTTNTRFWGDTIRFYKTSTTTFSSESVTIIKVEFVGDGDFTADCGIIANNIWTGSTNSVTFSCSSTQEVESIIITYTSSTEPQPATFTGLDPELITFESDDTEAQTVTIEGSNLENAESVSVVNSNETNFEVIYNESDYTFTVAPKAANDTDAAYTATITVTVDETVHTMKVSQVGAAQSYAGKIIYAIEFVSDDNLAAPNDTEAQDKIFGVYKFEWAQGTHKTLAPKYYTSGEGIRVYGGNTLTVSTTDGSSITSIDFDMQSSSYEYFSADTGSYDTSAHSWTGDATSITFTSSETATRIVSIVMNGDAGEGGDDNTGDDSGETMTISNIADMVVGTECKVEGTIVAATTSSFVISDASGSVFVYGGVSNHSIGDVITMQGTPATYNNGIQLSYSGSTVTTVSTGGSVTYPTPTTVTSSNIEDFATGDIFATYVEATGTLSSVGGNYGTITLDGATYSISTYFALSDFGLSSLVGSEVKVSGYFMSYSSSYTTVYLVVTAIEVTGDGGGSTTSQVVITSTEVAEKYGQGDLTSSGVDYDELEYTKDGVTFLAEKGTSSYVRIWYYNGLQLRFYNKGTVTISSEEVISSVEFGCASGAKNITLDEDNSTDYKKVYNVGGTVQCTSITVTKSN